MAEDHLAAHNQVPLPQENDNNGQTIADSFRLIQMEMRSQTFIKQIREFDGEGGRRFMDWLRDVERVGTAIRADDEQYKAIILQTLRGPAAEFTSRYISDNPAANWPNIRHTLVQQYSDTGDRHLARQKLRRMTQRANETIQNFAQRIVSMAEDAFTREELNNRFVQFTLIETFTDGVTDDRIARKLIRDRPNTFDAAVRSACDEQQTARAFNIRRRAEEPMDVNVTDRTAVSTNATEALRKDIEALTAQVAALSANTGGHKTNFKTKFQYTQDGKPICHYCKKVGHIERKCRKKRFDEQISSKPSGNSSGN